MTVYVDTGLDTPDRPLTVPQAAKRLGISTSMAYRLIERGDFPVPVLRIGRLIKVPRKPLDRLLAGE